MEDPHYSEYRLKTYITNFITGGYETYNEDHIKSITNSLEYFCLIHTTCENIFDMSCFQIKLKAELNLNDIQFLTSCMDLSYIGIFSDKPIDSKIISKMKIKDKKMKINYNVCYNKHVNLFDELLILAPEILTFQNSIISFKNSCFYNTLNGIKNENNS